MHCRRDLGTSSARALDEALICSRLVFERRSSVDNDVFAHVILPS